MSAEGSHEQLIADVGGLRAEVADIAADLEDAQKELAKGYGDARSRIFTDMADPAGVIRGEDIVDFAKQMRRLAGESPKDADRAAEQLATVFVPPHNAQPTPAYFYNRHRGSLAGDFIVVANPAAQPGESARLGFALGRRDPKVYLGDRFGLKAFGGGELGILNNDYLDLKPSNGPTPRWTLGRVSNEVLIDFAKLNIVDDPEVVKKEGARTTLDTDRIYLGDAVEAAVVRDHKEGRTVYDPEAVALLALLRQAQSKQPNMPFVNSLYGTTSHTEKTLRLASHYAATLLGETAEEVMQRGLPVQLHEAALKHQGIGRGDIGRALLKGIELGGGAFTPADIESLSARIESGKKPKIPHTTVDAALLSKAGQLAENMSEVNSRSGLNISAEELLALAEREPGLFRVALKPKLPRHPKVDNAIDAYFARAKRFRASTTAS